MSTSSEEDLLKLVKDLQKVMNGKRPMEDAQAILDQLKSQSMTQAQIQNTRVGLILNEFRKTECGESCATLSKQLIKHWKKHVTSNATDPDAVVIPPFAPATSSPKANGENNGSVTPSNSTLDAHRVRLSGDETRDKYRQMLSNSFKKDELPDGTLDPDYVAQEIEQAIYAEHKGTNSKYAAAIRSRVFNLRDKKNKALKDNVLTGVIAAHAFAVMKAEEMASDEVKQMRVKFTKEALNDYQMAQEAGTATDMFKCGKCKKKDCTYRQAQTRSADEPMTTFVWCRNCGNRWKFC